MRLRLATNVLVVSGVIGAALVLKKVVRSRRLAKDSPTDESEFAWTLATQSGIAEVDPEPISHVAGEGIDLDRDVEAHETIPEQRARLPHLS